MVQFSLTRYVCKKDIKHNLEFFLKASIGFLGLGNMGKHMATNLLSTNHHVTIFDTNSKAFDHFKGQSKLFLLNQIKFI